MLLNTVLIIIAILLAGLAGLWVFGERGRILQPSTRAWLKESGFNAKFLNGYVYGRWSNQYIGYGINWRFPRLEPEEGKIRWAKKYHGKVLPLDLARELITIEEDIDARNLEQIIPHKMARDLILDASPDIAVYDCPCRAAREDPCTPVDVCMIVGQPFVDFVMEHNPGSSRRITRTEALDLLQAEHDRGHVHVAYFKNVMLDRFYAICNCCSCCCGGIDATMNCGVPMVMSSGFVAQVDASTCAGCMTCQEVCPFDAIEADGGALVNNEKCMGCGVCVGVCPNEGITLVRDTSKADPLDVRILQAN